MTAYTTNPLAQAIEESEEVIDSLRKAADRLSHAIQMAAVAKARAQDAKESLSAAEAELVYEAQMLAQAKEGPLAGLATSSKGYSYALDKLLSEARQAGLSGLYNEANRYAIEADRAAIELQQAQTMFSALKHIADLKGSILRAHQPFTV